MSKFHLSKDAETHDVFGLYLFYCPGCEYHHHVHTLTPNAQGKRWDFNGDVDKPTLNSSLLVNKDYPELRCRSLIKDGNISFLSDCHHHLRDLTVEIPEWEDVESEDE